jgi:hypothetical protein
MKNPQNPQKSPKHNGEAVLGFPPGPWAEIFKIVHALQSHAEKLASHHDDLEAPLARFAGLLTPTSPLLRGGRLPRGLAAKAGQAQRSLTLANLVATEIDLDLGDLQCLLEAAANPEQAPALVRRARKTEFAKVKFLTSYRRGKVVYYEFLLDGRLRSLPQASGELLKALSADEGTSPDDYVSFKSGARLQSMLGVDARALTTRRNRLRNLLADFGYTRDVLEDHPRGGAWRLRVRRQCPTVGSVIDR